MKVSGMLWAGLVALSLAGCATRGPAVDSPVLRDPEALAAAQALADKAEEGARVEDIRAAEAN